MNKPIPCLWPLSDQFHFSVEELLTDLNKALKRTPFDEKNQLCLVGLDSDHQDPYQFSGSLYDQTQKKFLKKESDFTYFMDVYRDLSFFRVFEQLKKALPFRVGRMRILKLAPRSCYSMHQDDGLRFHLALQTNSHSFLCFKSTGAFHIPADGKVYGSNTMLEHTAMNGGLEPRIHVVLNTLWDEEAGNLFTRNINL